MAGSAILRNLQAKGFGAQYVVVRTHKELDLPNQSAVRSFFQQEKPEQLYLAAACLQRFFEKRITINHWTFCLLLAQGMGNKFIIFMYYVVVINSPIETLLYEYYSTNFYAREKPGSYAAFKIACASQTDACRANWQ
jgi:hypothetical protein